jgi:integrase/recombinase XerD
MARPARQSRPHRSDAGLAQLFLDMLAAERGAGDNTLSAYRSDLDDLAAFLAARKSSFASADTEALRAYLADLDARGFKSTTVARRLSAMRHLFRFLLTERIRSDDPAAILSGPKRGRALPKVLTIADVDRLLAQAKAATEIAELSAAQRLRALRLYCLLEVLYATGLRVSELVSLPVTAARRDARMIVVRGKGDKERLVPLNDAARTAMAAYLAAHDAAHGKDGRGRWLFPSFGDSGHLTRQHFARELKTLGVAAGLSGAPVHPHALRHAFASHLLQNGADLRVVQELLGHASLSTTQIYAAVDKNRLLDAWRSAHPRGRDNSKSN